MTNIFTDAIIHEVQGKGTGEPADFLTMIDRAEILNGTKILYTADKAYAVPNQCTGAPAGKRAVLHGS